MTTTDNSTHLDIDVHELLARRRQIAHIWGIDDVQGIRPDLNDDDAWTVLQTCERHLDSYYGLSWTTIEITADELFPTNESHEEGDVA